MILVNSEAKNEQKLNGFAVGPCRVPGSVCRFYYPNRKFYSNKLYSNKWWRDKQDWQGDLPLETAKHSVCYALSTKLSRCNDHGPSPSASKSSSTLSGLATVVLICLFSGTRIPDRYGNRVPGSKNIRKRTGLICSAARLMMVCTTWNMNYVLMNKFWCSSNLVTIIHVWWLP